MWGIGMGDRLFMSIVNQTEESDIVSSIDGNYPIFSLNCHILYFQMYFQYLFFSKKYPNNV